MGKCTQGEVWFSTRRGQPDGKFTITQIDGDGNFTGDHDGDRIHGTCKDNIIRYSREGSPRRSYSGEYVSETRIEGVASELPELNVRMLLPVDDDWVGTHTT